VTLQSACEVALAPEDLQICQCEITTLADEAWESLSETASDILADVTGLPIGQCVHSWRPCMDRCVGSPCGCCELRGVTMPGWNPRLVEVRVDGEVVPTTEYAILRKGTELSLERFYSNGRARPWPGCQSLLLPDTAEGTFAVKVLSGVPIDWQVRAAAAEIACDLLKRWTDDLPDGITSMTVYGMTVDFRRYGEATGDTAVQQAGFEQVAKLMNRYPVNRQVTVIAPELMRGWSYYERLDPSTFVDA